MPPIPVTNNCLRKGHDALFVGHSNFHVQNPYQPWEVEIDPKTIDGLSGGAYDFLCHCMSLFVGNMVIS